MDSKGVEGMVVSVWNVRAMALFAVNVLCGEKRCDEHDKCGERVWGSWWCAWCMVVRAGVRLCVCMCVRMRKVWARARVESM